MNFADRSYTPAPKATWEPVYSAEHGVSCMVVFKEVHRVRPPFTAADAAWSHLNIG